MVVSQGALQLGLSSLLAIVLFGIFGYEYEMPLFLNIILVPIIVALGYLFALGLHVSFGFEMLVSMGIEFFLLMVAIFGFHTITT